MMHIIRGSQVRVNFSMVAFSHSDVSNMHAYDGMPCLLDIIAGTGMILNALDLAILSMEVGEERDIVVPAVESAHTARILGINIRGCLMYKLKVLQVVNTPVGCAEVEDFLSKSCVSLHDLSEIKSVKKGPFKIERSYDMFEANAISAQYRILESLYKEHMTKDTPSSLSSSDNQTSSSSSLHDSFNGNNAAEFISKIHVNSIKYKTINPESCNSNSSGRCSSTLSDNKSNATFGYSESESCGDFRMNGNVQYVLPSWPLNQPKELFLPELFRIAVAKQTRIIILFDKLEDWDTINELINIERSKAVLRDIESHRNRGSKGGPYHNTGHNSGQTSATTYQSGGAVIEAEVEMAVESEEVDSTGETILTWLRVATESTSTANAAATNTAESTCTDTKTDTNTDAMSSGSSADNKDAVRKHSTSNSTTPSDFTANQGNADDKIVSSINIISGIPTGQDPYGYRVALIRFCGWDRGAPPQKRLWDGFWKMYMRYVQWVREMLRDGCYGEEIL